MRVFTTKWFARFARKENIGADRLLIAIRETERGLHDGSLGGGLIKKRIARAGAGKSGGYRTIIVFRAGERAVFVYGFAESVADNSNEMELREYRKLAAFYLELSDAKMDKALRDDELKEIKDDA